MKKLIKIALVVIALVVIALFIITNAIKKEDNSEFDNQPVGVYITTEYEEGEDEDFDTTVITKEVNTVNE